MSRSTLRTALFQLRREGLIQVAQGRPTRIARRPGKRGRGHYLREVGLLTPHPLEAFRPFMMFLTDELREHLADAGYHLVVHAGHRFYSGQPLRALENLVQEKPAAGWVIYFAPLEVQRWFSERGLPAVVAGSCHPGVHLPSVDVDYRAACRHAAALFLAKGHQRIALLISGLGLAGDLKSEQGFLEAFKERGLSGPQPLIIHHDGTVPRLCAKLDGLLHSNEPPTALMVAGSNYFLTALSHLQRRGLRIPRDVSMISRDDDSFLRCVVPSVARYSCNPAFFAQNISRLVLRVARGESVARRERLVMPQYVKGDSFA